MSITEIHAWQCSDGERFESETIAQEHETIIIRSAKIQELINDTDVNEIIEWGPSDFAKWIACHYDQIREVTENV